MSDLTKSVSFAGPVSGLVSGLSYSILMLATIASGVGLFIPEVYRDNAWVTAQNRGTDLVTLVIVVPATLVVLAHYQRGSARARLVLFGLLGYFFYVYTVRPWRTASTISSSCTWRSSLCPFLH